MTYNLSHPFADVSPDTVEPRLNNQPLTTAPSIPGYDIIGYLGTGGMASVYLAVDTDYGHQVAVKIMSPVLAADPQYGDRFVREAQIAAGFSHPGVSRIYELGEVDRRFFIVMEYLPGGELTARIEAGAAGEAVAITRQIAAALAYAHAQGYLHGDVKPGNILFRADGSAVLTDFGIARPSERSSQETQLGVVVGTPQYMSPEQIRGRATDARSDLYALGIVFYEILTGDVPFDGKNALEIGIKHIREPIPQLPDELQPLQPVIDRLLAKHPDDRFDDAGQLIEALDALGMAPPPPSDELRADSDDALTTAATAAADAGASPRPAPARPARRLGWPAVGALAVALTGAALWHFAQTGQLQPALQRLTSHPDYQRARAAVYRGITALQLQEPRWPAWLERLKVDFGSDTGGGTAAATAAEDALAATVGDSIGAAIGAQTSPGLTNAAGMAARASGALTGLRVATIPRLDKQTEIINEMLTHAAGLLAAGTLASPAGANALQAYREVLTLDERNAAALAGQEAVLLGLLNHIDAALGRGDIEGARSILATARAAGLDAQLLDAAEATLDAAADDASTDAATKPSATAAGSVAAAQPRPDGSAIGPTEQAQTMLDRLKITGLLRGAEFDVGEGRLTSPADDNAWQKYREVLQLDPGNEAARQGLQNLTRHIVTDLEAASNDGDRALYATRLADLALVAPDHPLLSAAGGRP